MIFIFEQKLYTLSVFNNLFFESNQKVSQKQACQACKKLWYNDFNLIYK